MPPTAPSRPAHPSRAAWRCLASLALAAPAQAGWLGDALRSVSLEADAGVYAGRLSAGLTGFRWPGADETATDRAVGSVGRGEGLLWSLTGRLSLLGHDLLFNYVADDVLDDATRQAAGDALGSGRVADAILWLAGELRPDLGDLLGDGRPWVRLEYGDFEGSIDEAWRFGTRNGRPWFGGRDAGWRTRLLNVEAGQYVAYHVREPGTRRRRGDDDPERGAAGVYLRYTQFSRPVVLGYDPDGGTGFALQDADLGMLALGLRWDVKQCSGIWCGTAVGSFIPFTGWTWLDLGRFGTQRGVVLSGGFDLRGSVRWQVAGSFEIEPYVSFRADWLFPITGTFFDASIDTYTLWAPDYLLWGPGAGLQVRL